MFNRRHFIKLFSLAAAALVAEPSGMAVAEVSTFDPKDMMPAIADYVFKKSPLLIYFKGCPIEYEEYTPLHWKD